MNFNEPDTLGLKEIENLAEGLTTIKRTNESLASSIKAFDLNVRRAVNQAAILPFIVALITERERGCCFANHKVSGRVDLTAIPDTGTAKQLADEAQRYIDAMFVDYTPEQTKDFRWKWGVEIFNSILNTPQNSFFMDATEKLMASVLIGTWTAIEVLSEDMWIAALNSHPVVLAKLGGSSFGAWRVGWDDENDGKKQASKSKDESKTVSLDLLEQSRYNISHKMGTILRPKVRFSTLSAIRASYCKAFSSNQADLQKAFASVSLDYLAALRNVLIHNAGKADSDFKNQVKGNARLSAIIEGESIKIDGYLLKDVVKPAVVASAEIINAATAWLEAN